jgi:hypothetical protein
VNDAELRAAYRDARAAAGREIGPCPEPGLLQALVERAGPEPERLRTLDHVMACRTCSDELELLRTVAGAPPVRSPSRKRILALAASLVLLGGAGLGSWALNRSGGPVTYRAAGASITLLAPAEGAGAATRTFVWSSVPDAVSYRLEIFDSQGAAFFSTTTTDTLVTLPESVALDPSARPSWWVQARLRDGSEVASPTASIGGGER